MDGLGAQEVIIETPYHYKDFNSLSIDNVILILKTYRQRYLDLFKDGRIKYILIFKNYGVDGGASFFSRRGRQNSSVEEILISYLVKK